MKGEYFYWTPKQKYQEYQKYQKYQDASDYRNIPLK